MSDSWNDFIAGWISGVAGIIVGSPLDVLKARLQVPTTTTTTATLPAIQHSIKGSDQVPRLGSWATFRKMIQTEGAGSMFKGVLSPIVGLAGLNALLFASYGSVIRYFENKQGQNYVYQKTEQPFIPSLGQVYFAGFAAGTACFLLSTPIELVKIQAQVAKVPLSTYGVAKRIYARGGLKGFYQGGLLTIIRDAPSYGLYFWVYEGLKRLLNVAADDNGNIGTAGPDYCQQNDCFQGTTNNSMNACKLLLAGGMAGVTSWVAIYPIDVVKSRLQMQQQQIQQQKPQIRYQSTLPSTETDIKITAIKEVGKAQRQNTSSLAILQSSTICNYNESTSLSIDRPYASIKDCVMRSFRNEGLGFFFRGLWPTVLRAFPVNAVTFYVYELTMDLLN